MAIKDSIVDLETLKEQDTYSLSLFLLYKLSDIPKYTTISELPYILDKTNLLKLCKYYGGRTITIPTIEEMMKTMKILLMYQYNVVEGLDFNSALLKCGYELKESKSVDTSLKHLKKLLKTYNLEGSSIYE